MLEMRDIAADNWLISNCDMYFMTRAAASWPIDIMTTADFSTSERLARAPGMMSVTGHPSSDDLRRPRGVIGDQRLHGLGFDAEDVLRRHQRAERLGERPAGPRRRGGAGGGGN